MRQRETPKLPRLRVRQHADNSPTLAAVVQALTIAPEGEDEEGLAKSMIGDRAA